MLDLKTIWKRPYYAPYVQPPLTDKMVIDAEKQWAYKLPSELIDLLNLQNGGYLRKLIKNEPFSYILGIDPHRPSLTTLIWDEEWLLPFEGNGHWHLCLDYSKNKNAPCITMISQEQEDRNIAGSFKEYLSLLQLWTYGQLVLV